MQEEFWIVFMMTDQSKYYLTTNLSLQDYREANLSRNTRLHSISRWVPSHSGIKSNEADSKIWVLWKSPQGSLYQQKQVGINHWWSLIDRCLNQQTVSINIYFYLLNISSHRTNKNADSGSIYQAIFVEKTAESAWLHKSRNCGTIWFMKNLRWNFGGKKEIETCKKLWTLYSILFLRENIDMQSILVCMYF